MNLGNKLAVGEAVDLGIDPGVDEVAVPEPARPTPATIVVVPEEPVAAHAER